MTSSIQISRGMRYSYNPSNKKGKRLITLEIGQPKLKPIDFQKTYTIGQIRIIKDAGLYSLVRC